MQSITFRVPRNEMPKDSFRCVVLKCSLVIMQSFHKCLKYPGIKYSVVRHAYDEIKS